MLPLQRPSTRSALPATWGARVAPAVVLLAAMVLVAGLSGGLSPRTAAAQQDERAQLSSAREELAAIAERLQEAEGAEQEADRALGDAETALQDIERILNEVAESVERQRAAVRDAERRLLGVQREAEQLQEAFASRIARLYMQGPELTIELLLSSDDADEAIARTVLLERLTEGDQVDLERLEASRVVVDAERERLAAEQSELEDRLEEQRLVREEADALRSRRALEAADARARTERLASQQDDLEAEEERLEVLIREQQEQEARRRAEAERQAEAERRAEQSAASDRRTASEGGTASAPAPDPGSSGSSSGGSSGSSGGFAWPMCAPVTSEYGPRWGRVHRGIDQGASTGTPIGAAKAGRVIFAGWQGGYGNLILIDHGGTVSAYAHQSRFAVGQGAQVSRGQTIGYVGSTGNSTGPHLHLEIRVNGSAVNPRQYLSGSPC